MIPNRGLGRCSLRLSVRARATSSKPILRRHSDSGAEYNGRGGEYSAHH